MPVEITMPQLSDTMTEGTVQKWLFKEGDKVKAGQTIAEVETDKAVMEMESFEAGTIATIAAKEGDKVKVGGVLAVLATGKETVEDVRKSAGSGTSTKQHAEANKTTSHPVGPVHTTTMEPEHGHEHGHEAKPHDKASVSNGAGRGQDVNGRAESERLRVSPLARRIAEEKGVDLSTLTGTGPGGRIVQADVLNAPKRGATAPSSTGSAASAARPAPPAAPLPVRVARGAKEVVTLNKMRQTIALRLQQSKQQIPHFYESIDVDMEAITTLRERLNKQFEKQGVKLSVSDFINKAIAATLVQHPNVNSHFSADKNEFTRFGDVNLGIAVALPDGLIVPVLRNIDQMGLKEIRQRSVDLADRARAGKLKGEEMTGATFTVSTLGQWGVSHFNAIINPPEVGILAVGVAEKRAVVRGDQIVARMTMTVTISVDHRVVDGALAAEFLKTLKSLLEEPGLMLA